jgi:hypothetical protein
MFYASYGGFIHQLLEMYLKGKISKEDAKIMFITEFSTKVHGERPSAKTVVSYIEKGTDYLENLKPFDIETVSVEERGYFHVDGVKFVCVIDFIGKTDEGYYIIDHKSRELKQRSGRKKPTANDLEIDKMLRQLYLYSIYVKENYGEYPKYLCFNCFKNGEFIKEEFDIDKLNETKEWVIKEIEYIKGAESGDFHPNVEFFQCKYLCGYADECCYWLQR